LLLLSVLVLPRARARQEWTTVYPVDGYLRNQLG